MGITDNMVCNRRWVWENLCCRQPIIHTFPLRRQHRCVSWAEDVSPSINLEKNHDVISKHRSRPCPRGSIQCLESFEHVHAVQWVMAYLEAATLKPRRPHLAKVLLLFLFLGLDLIPLGSRKTVRDVHHLERSVASGVYRSKLGRRRREGKATGSSRQSGNREGRHCCTHVDVVVGGSLDGVSVRERLLE